MVAYYNEVDPYAAAWLRNLIGAGHIAPGEVDDRSILDVRPADLVGYTQCHFFAGIGVWSAALRGAGWPDDRSVWTGSCPCQPFSAAGRGEGFADERHLWPAWFHLISQRRPPVVFGEQVASKAVDPWIDLVQADMEAVGYAFGAVAFPSAGVGAPHIRDRTYFVADTGSSGVWRGREYRDDLGSTGQIRGEVREQRLRVDVCADSSVGLMGDAIGARLEGHAGNGGAAGRSGSCGSASEASVSGGMADAQGHGHERARQLDKPSRRDGASHGGADGRPGPTNGFWRDPDWLFCRDGKWRPVEPSTSPLFDGSARRLGRDGPDQEALAALPRKDQGNRVGRLRAYGNAINLEAAAEFILAYEDMRAA